MKCQRSTTLGWKKYREGKIRVCDKNSIPLRKIFFVIPNAETVKFNVIISQTKAQAEHKDYGIKEKKRKMIN